MCLNTKKFGEIKIRKKISLTQQAGLKTHGLRISNSYNLSFWLVQNLSLRFRIPKHRENDNKNKDSTFRPCLLPISFFSLQSFLFYMLICDLVCRTSLSPPYRFKLLFNISCEFIGVKQKIAVSRQLSALSKIASSLLLLAMTDLLLI